MYSYPSKQPWMIIQLICPQFLFVLQIEQQPCQLPLETPCSISHPSTLQLCTPLTACALPTYDDDCVHLASEGEHQHLGSIASGSSLPRDSH